MSTHIATRAREPDSPLLHDARRSVGGTARRQRSPPKKQAPPRRIDAGLYSGQRKPHVRVSSGVGNGTVGCGPTERKRRMELKPEPGSSPAQRSHFIQLDLRPGQAANTNAAARQEAGRPPTSTPSRSAWPLTRHGWGPGQIACTTPAKPLNQPWLAAEQNRGCRWPDPVRRTTDLNTHRGPLRHHPMPRGPCLF